MPPLLADFTHARPCKPFCEKYLTLPTDDMFNQAGGIFCSKQTVFRAFCMKMPGRKLDGVPLCLLNFDSKHRGTPSNKNRAAVYIASYPHN